MTCCSTKPEVWGCCGACSRTEKKLAAINYKHDAGVPEIIGPANEATRGGGICEVGFFVDNGTCSINPHQDICTKEITLVGSWVYTVDEYPIAYNFLRRAQGIGLPVESLITHRFPLEKISEAMEVNMRQEGLKVAIIP